ncbi:PE domain-containing protein [Mycobacterium sp. SM1]|uniref:PPE family protein, SVP subgroup n=1 Tax=Mycobacterium sp. SM1 TaxID=2816243 RepID=UPI001BCF2A93|nr:PE domain-containing protein [Mycobacterium sp. SM1]MBS4729209.1 PE domain-containing protein [Mycobacterium sp. SM1]
MSFVTTLPEALTCAAARLQSLGSAMAVENAAAAAPTTGVIPAAADPVSVLQALQFAAYGTWYQHVSAHAQAIQEMFVNALRTSAGSYADTEAANTAATGSPVAGFSGPLGGLTSSSTSSDPGLISNVANLLNIQAGNWGSAASDLIGMSGGGLLTAIPAETAEGAGADIGLAASLDGSTLANTVAPAGSGLGGAPVLAGRGQASSVGGLSVPPSWAGEAVPAASAAPAMVTGAGWTAAAPVGAPAATVPAGMPAVATVSKATGLGAPRYGVKPTVMPKPEVV